MSIEVRNLSCVYGSGTPFETKALNDVSFTIESGEFVGIMGRTGCGKSTLIQAIAGLLPITSGEVFLDNADINAKSYDRSILRRKLGIVFQYPECQLFESTVEKDVAFGLKHSGVGKDEVASRVKWALEVCGFDYEKVRRQSPLGLSGGEKRRIAISGVLAVKPEYLILDEPIAGLDPLRREAFLKLITKLNSDGMTVIMVSHNADCIAEYARRILVLDNGCLAADGTPQELFADADNMKRLHLGVSRSREVGMMLSEKGFSIAPEICTYNELLSAVCGILKGGEPDE